MRIVWASVAFLTGVGTALVVDFSPGRGVPAPAFWMFTLATGLTVTALIVSRRRTAYVLLIAIFLLGVWRGGDALPEVADTGYDFTETARIGASNYGYREGPVNRIRTFVADELISILGEMRAGLPAALLTGERSLLDTELTNDFRSAGLAHLLAISGLHVSLVGGIAMGISVVLFGRRRAAYLFVPLTLVFVYAALAGFAPPITRAAIMFSVFILGRLMGRGSHTLAALALAGVLMVAWEPAILASLSFQLSFTAMIGISFVAPMLESPTEISTQQQSKSLSSNALDRVRRFVLGSLVISLASTVGTLPLVALHFDAVPIWGGAATLLAVPAMPIVIISSAFIAAVGLLPLPLISEVAAYPVIVTVEYLTSIARFFAHVPPGPIQTDVWTVWTAGVFYACLAILIAVWPRVKTAPDRIKSMLSPSPRQIAFPTNTFGIQLGASAVLLLLGAAMWVASFQHSEIDNYLTVKFLSTSHGESIFIETPNGNRMLIDGGGHASEVADALNSLTPPWDREIDIVMLTHPDADHVGGLPEVLQRFRVGTVIHPDIDASSDAFKAWSQAIENHNNNFVAWRGMTLGLDQGVFLEIIASGCGNGAVECSDINDGSIVTMLRHGDISFLLTGDIERNAEARLLASNTDLRTTVLKAPHHGSITSSTQTFLNAVEPVAIVVAAGTGNRYGHPHPEVVARLQQAVGQDRVLRTDILGTVELRTDGERLWMVR